MNYFFLDGVMYITCNYILIDCYAYFWQVELEDHVMLE